MCAFISLHQKLSLSRSCSQALLAYAESHPIRKLQLGAGTNILEGWFNTDITPTAPEVFFLDATSHFPFENATFHYIFSEHHIEHLSYNEGLFTFQECYRILKPGGVIRIATPNLETLLALYTTTPNQLQKRYIQFITDTFLPDTMLPTPRSYNPVFVINNAFRNWGHQFLYDQTTLQSAMEDVGFTHITLATPGKSNDEQLCEIEKHGRFIGDEEINRFETIVLEGKRPL